MKTLHVCRCIFLTGVIILSSACASGGGSTAQKAPDEKTRLRRVLWKLKKGGTVNVAALGGSITTGYLANPPAENGWAGLTGRQLEKLGAGTRGRVNFINLGVSGTDSAAAACRVRTEVADARPTSSTSSRPD
jgi:lysophospholipase L1-like esterase